MRTEFMFISFISAMSSWEIFSERQRPESGQKEWRQQPLSMIRLPLRIRPAPARTSSVRKPNFRRTVWTTAPLSSLRLNSS